MLVDRRILQQDRRRVQHHAEVEAASGQKQPPADQPDADGKALLQVFVDRPQLHIVEEFQEHEQHDRQRQHRGQPEQQHGASVVIRFARHRDVADRAEERGEERNGDRPPLHPPPGEKVIFGVLLFLAEPAAEREAQQQIERNDEVVDSSHRSDPFPARQPMYSSSPAAESSRRNAVSRSADIRPTGERIGPTSIPANFMKVLIETSP
ncbi:hypothetical protein SDC9_178796 [bioreactor metagenome]|uniref:Uncharacterized protein n=1 Tax=bioreactor metagenome TaxID=1076179 RepID=A0A645GZ38_9ZZZZ